MSLTYKITRVLNFIIILKQVCSNNIVADSIDTNKTSVPVRGLREECTKHAICNTTENLVCDLDHICRIGEGQQCTRPRSQNGEASSCVQNSKCDMLPFSYAGRKEYDSCICNADHFPHDNGTCVRKLNPGALCTETLQCLDSISKDLYYLNATTTCKKGKCVCNPKFSFELTENNETRCRRKAGQRCHHPDSYFAEGWVGDCVPGSVCERYSRTCRCKMGLYRLPNGTCGRLADLDDSCNHEKPCYPNLKCDNITNNCVCQSGQIRHPEKKECVHKLGSVCTSEWEKNILLQTHQWTGCVPNARCDPVNSNSHASYRCQCANINFSPSKDSKDYCYVKEGQKCSGDQFLPITSNTCLPGLVCVNRNCSCRYKEYQVYIESEEKCFSKVGGPCNATEECLDKHSSCNFVNGVGPCQCKSGYVQFGDTCDLGYGQPCNNHENETVCDRFNNLECGYRGKCECPELMIFDKRIMACKGLVGAHCNSKDYKGNCIQGAYCEKIRGYKETGKGVCKCEATLPVKADRTCYINGTHLLS